MKKVFIDKNETTMADRGRIRAMYDEIFFNIWLSSRSCKGLSSDQFGYLMRRLWGDGKVLAFSIIKPQKAFLGGTPSEFAEGLIGFSQFSENTYNMYNYPIKVNPVNERGVPWIPSRMLINHKDCVIGYAQKSRQPIRSVIDTYIEKIVSVEMTIRTNLIANKKSLLIIEGATDKNRKQDISLQLMNDEPCIKVHADDPSSIQASNPNIPLIIPQLYSYLQSLINEALTELGIDNQGSATGDFQSVDVANANNVRINLRQKNMDDCFKEFEEEVKEVLGYDIHFESNIEKAVSVREETNLEGSPNNDGGRPSGGNDDGD